ncbi:hypothetical protein OAT67_07965, partial [Bacteriovoracaceae bacterium]|nr:hypothetical protein [Bacteriovoracaceae bacterium]
KPQYWNNQGNCFFLSNDYYKALWSYNIGSTKSKKLNTVAQNNIGVILLNQNNTKEALAVFSELVKKTKNLTPLFNLAHAYLEMGLIQSSNTLFKKLYHKNRNDSDFVFGLALTESLKGNYKYSSGLIRTIQDQDKDDVLFVNALNLYGLKQYEQAQLTLEKQGLVLALNVKKSSQKLHSLIEAKIKEMEKRSQNNRAVANK